METYENNRWISFSSPDKQKSLKQTQSLNISTKTILKIKYNGSSNYAKLKLWKESLKKPEENNCSKFNPTNNYHISIQKRLTVVDLNVYLITVRRNISLTPIQENAH